MIQDSCQVHQPRILKGQLLEQSKKFEKDPKFAGVNHYDDVSIQLQIDSNGILWSSSIHSFENDAGSQQVWHKFEKLSKNFQKATKFLVSKDTRNLKFPNFRTNQTKDFAGDFLYIMADGTLHALMISKTGQIYEDFEASIETELEKDKLTRIMVVDNNTMALCDKRIAVFQFQNLKFQAKQHFQQFKDVEDVMITRLNGMRLFKVKATKTKFKVFSTLPSSDWNPYIEGVSKKELLNKLEYPKIELIDAKYGNVVIMAYTGKHYKYFVV